MKALTAHMDVPQKGFAPRLEKVEVVNEKGIIYWDKFVRLEKTYNAGERFYEIATHLKDEGILTHSKKGSYFFTSGSVLHTIAGFFDFSREEDARAYQEAYNNEHYAPSSFRVDLNNRLRLVQRLED